MEKSIFAGSGGLLEMKFEEKWFPVDATGFSDHMAVLICAESGLVVEVG